jgi:hypothetical protein
MTEERKEMAKTPSEAEDSPERLSGADMLDQLQVIARQIAGDAPPALREASVVAAELAATVARGTGPIAHTLADVTDDASLRFAERMETYAASVRESDDVEVVPSDSTATDGDSAATEATGPAEMEERG